MRALLGMSIPVREVESKACGLRHEMAAPFLRRAPAHGEALLGVTEGTGGAWSASCVPVRGVLPPVYSRSTRQINNRGRRETDTGARAARTSENVKRRVRSAVTEFSVGRVKAETCTQLPVNMSPVNLSVRVVTRETVTVTRV